MKSFTIEYELPWRQLGICVLNLTTIKTQLYQHPAHSHTPSCQWTTQKKQRNFNPSSFFSRPLTSGTNKHSSLHT